MYRGGDEREEQKASCGFGEKAKEGRSASMAATTLKSDPSLAVYSIHG